MIGKNTKNFSRINKWENSALNKYLNNGNIF